MTESDLLQLDDAAFIERAYLLALGRPADPHGLRAYVERLRSGVDRQLIMAELRSSDEGRNHAGKQAGRRVELDSGVDATAARRFQAPTVADLLSLSDEAFVDRAYRLALGRPADPSGQMNYLRELRLGVERLDVLHELLESAEGRRLNAPLPELRSAIAARRTRRLPGIRHALRAWRRMRAKLHGGNPDPEALVAEPVSRSTVAEGLDPIRRRDDGAASSTRYLQPIIMNSTDTADAPLTASTAEGAVAGSSTVRAPACAVRLESAAAEVADLAATDPTKAAQDARQPDVEPGAEWKLRLERFVGSTLHGWSAAGGRAATVSAEFAQRTLGKIVPSIERPDVSAKHDLSENRVGFAAVLGGLLQFSAMAPECRVLKIAHLNAAGVTRHVDLQEHLAEALTFAPMRALARPLRRKVGQLRSMRLISSAEASLIFEAEADESNSGGGIFVDLYQEEAPGTLARIARFSIELGGQIADLEFRMLDERRPILMVITDANRAIIATDCIPLPALFSEANAPLIDYHVVLESGKSAFGVAAKLARTFLDSAISARHDGPQASEASLTLRSTCLVLYVRGNADLPVAPTLRSHRALAGEVIFLNHSGQVHAEAGDAVPLADYVASSEASHFLFHDCEARLRPDFWSVLENNRFRITDAHALTHWHSIWLDGLARPQVVKGGLLLDPRLAGHEFLEARSLLVRRSTVERALERDASRFASGRLVLERVFEFVPQAEVALLPVVMHTVRVPIMPLQVQRYQAEHVVLPLHPADEGSASSGAGVSVIINYRDGVEDTLRCLTSIAAQQLGGPLEVVLVNNGSTVESVDAVLSRARELFGADNVRGIDYPYRFNHSTQCNLAVVTARHEMLLMLSNDSVLRTPRAILRAAEVAAIPWVGSCGFRIIGDEANKSRLQSLGLTLNPRRYLFSGGSPVSTSLAPTFALDRTFEVIGNTFAAVMLRRQVYRELDGLDSDAFPTNYNDVDFSFRATNAGYRHVVIGSEVVEHVGRGSREADQDLPIDQRIIERAPRLDLLARVGFQQL